MRECRVERRICHLYFGALVEGTEELLLNLEEFVDVAAGLVLELDNETVRCTVTGNHWRSEEHQRTIFDVLCCDAVELAHNIVGAFVLAAQRPVLELYNHRAVAVTLATGEAVTLNHNSRFHGRYAAHNRVEPGHNGKGVLLRSCRRHVDHSHYSTGVLVRNQAGRGGRHKPNQQSDGAGNDGQRYCLGLDEEVHHATVVAQEAFVVFVECYMEALYECHLLAGIVAVRLQQDGAQCRRQSQGVKSGDTDGECHGETELLIEHTFGAGHKRYRDKHEHHYEGNRDDGVADFAHGIDRGDDL